MNNIILCGFMGSGKTTVGKRLATLTGRVFVDMDAEIEQRAGKSISEIFARDGEPAFRQLEQEVCLDLARRSGLVIATGGGALLSPANREALAASGIIVLLQISPETVMDRLERDTTRPLLAGENKEDRIRQLLAQRLPVYQAAAHLVVDGEQAPDAVARQIAKQIANQTSAPREG